MASYTQAIEGFYNNSISLGKRLHEDSTKAADLFKKIEGEIDYDTIITGRHEHKLIGETQALGRVLVDWNQYYPSLLEETRGVLKLIVDDLKQIPGLNISVGNNDATIRLNEREFVFKFEKALPHAGGKNLIISDEQKKQLAKKENSILYQMAKILTLDINIQNLLSAIQNLNIKYKINTNAQTLQHANSTQSPDFLPALKTVANWWIHIKEILDLVKERVYDSVKLESKIAKNMEKIFYEERVKERRDQKLRVAKAGLSLVGSLALAIVPGGGLVQEAMDFGEKIKISHDLYKSVKEMRTK